MQNLIVALLCLKISKDNSRPAVHLVVDDRITLSCRIAYLPFRKRSCEHLHVIIVLLLLRSDSDGNLSSALYSLYVLSQEKVGFHFNDTLKSFC